MPAITEPPPAPGPANATLQFPPITREHILHCSYDSWFPKYRTSCIKSRIIPLSPEFVEYIREDGIVLADDDGDDTGASEDDEWQSGPSLGAGPEQPRIPNGDDDDDTDSESEEDEPPKLPPNQRFPELHQAIKDMIAELGGAVAPKLNWSAPKDATWISPHQNTIKCTAPNDIYLLLKSSNFITHDLEHAFDDCTTPLPPPPLPSSSSSNPNPSPESSSALTPSSKNYNNNNNNNNNNNAPSSSSSPSSPSSPASSLPFKPVLVLRSYFNPHTAMEFRCFVKHRSLVAISQRDLRHFDFLRALRGGVVARAAQLFNHRLRFTFPDGCFVFDVYIPENNSSDGDGGGPLGRARLIDINPWAPHTDSLLFGWQELLDLEVPRPILGTSSEDEDEEGEGEGREEDDDDGEEEDFVPELRLVEEDDQAAFSFSSPQYSAHKLPKEVVDASLAGEGGMREFALKWREMVEYRANVADWEMGGDRDH